MRSRVKAECTARTTGDAGGPVSPTPRQNHRPAADGECNPLFDRVVSRGVRSRVPIVAHVGGGSAGTHTREADCTVMTSPDTITDEQRWLTPGVKGIGTASFLADASHEVPTVLLPSLLTSTLDATPVALGVIEGVSDALAGLARLDGGALADDPNRRRLHSNRCAGRSNGRCDLRGAGGRVACRRLARRGGLVPGEPVVGGRVRSTRRQQSAGWACGVGRDLVSTVAGRPGRVGASRPASDWRCSFAATGPVFDGRARGRRARCSGVGCHGVGGGGSASS